MDNKEVQHLLSLAQALGYSYGVMAFGLKTRVIGDKDPSKTYYAALTVYFNDFLFTLYSLEKAEYIANANGSMVRDYMILQTSDNGYNQLMLIKDGEIKSNLNMEESKWLD